MKEELTGEVDAMDAQPAVLIEDVSFAYGNGPADRADGCAPVAGGVRGLSLTVMPGECVLLCGPSGCGKTTVTKLVNGLVPHVEAGRMAGRARVCGLDTREEPLYRLSEQVASVFQNPKSQFFNVDPESEITFGLENRGLDADFVRKRRDEAVSELGIERLLDSSMFALSGGEKQIVAFACAYAAGADVVVLDEPSANLDAGSTAAVARIVGKLKARGTTIIVAEHRLAYLAPFIDRAVYLENGRIVREFSGGELRALPSAQLAALGLRELVSTYGLAWGGPALDTRSPALEVESLACSYGTRPVFEHLSFKLRAGEVTALVGSNGTGKSTLVRCLCGLHRHDAGCISFDGRPTRARARRRLSYLVMQDVNRQLFGSSAFDECLLGNEGVTCAEVDAVLADLGLAALRDVHPLDLSGGQKQRLAVAVSLLAGKQALFFDEPTSGLDRASMESVADVLRGLAARGNIVCVATHDAELIACACTRCILLERSCARDLAADGIEHAMTSFASMRPT